MGYTDRNGTYHAYHQNIGLSLHSFRECDANGDVGDVTANGGILASNTTPIMRGASGLISQEISWAAGNAHPIVCQVCLPSDFDGQNDVMLDLWVSSGTTNAATMAVTSSWNAGATVTDSASDAATLSATMHKITATISADDIPDAASFVTLVITPPTHATDAIQLHAARMRYTAKTVS